MFPHFQPDKSSNNSIKSSVFLGSEQEIQAAKRAFAAVLSDGSVVSWGPKGHGGSDVVRVKEVVLALVVSFDGDSW
jgi:hypothetical protein